MRKLDSLPKLLAVAAVVVVVAAAAACILAYPYWKASPADSAPAVF